MTPSTKLNINPAGAGLHLGATWKDRARKWRSLILFAAVVAGLCIAWRFTPLADVITPQRVMAFARRGSGYWWAPVVLTAAYTPASVVMFPRQLITLFGIVAFGSWQAAGYGLAGIMLAALAVYAAGRKMDRATVTRIAGTKGDRVTAVLRRRGFLAMVITQIFPIAPFGVQCLLAGAIGIGLFDYLFGILLGTLPGTVATIVFGDQMRAAVQNPSQMNYGLIALFVLTFVAGMLLGRKVLAKACSESNVGAGGGGKADTSEKR